MCAADFLPSPGSFPFPAAPSSGLGSPAAGPPAPGRHHSPAASPAARGDFIFTRAVRAVSFLDIPALSAAKLEGQRWLKGSSRVRGTGDGNFKPRARLPGVRALQASCDRRHRNCRCRWEAAPGAQNHRSRARGHLGQQRLVPSARGQGCGERASRCFEEEGRESELCAKSK